MAVLTTTAGLTDKFAFTIRRLGDGFTIRDLRRTGVGLHFEFAEQAVTQDLQMQLTHAGDDELTGFLVGEATESRIFLGQLLQTFTHPLAIGLGLWLDRH